MIEFCYKWAAILELITKSFPQEREGGRLGGGNFVYYFTSMKKNAKKIRKWLELAH